MNNYRVNIRHNDFNIDYWKDFHSLRKHYPFIKECRDKANELGIRDFWFFFEPYIELTWLTDDESASHRLRDFIVANAIKTFPGCHMENLYPKDGNFGDWFCETEREREFGSKRHAICCDFIFLYDEYKDCVDSGKGLRNQVSRVMHTLCNPLGLNYIEEAKICLRRGIVCLAFAYLPRKMAFWFLKKLMPKGL